MDTEEMEEDVVNDCGSGRRIEGTIFLNYSRVTVIQLFSLVVHLFMHELAIFTMICDYDLLCR